MNKKITFNTFKRDVIIYLKYDLTDDQMLWAYNIYSLNPSNGIYPAVIQVVNKLRANKLMQ